MSKSFGPLYDADIRKLLFQHEETLKPQHNTLVIEEFELCQGGARIDIAAINGDIHGYEIKSDLDTLARLPSQATAYNKVMDTVTLVLSKDHLIEAKKLIPSWWGIRIIHTVNNKVSIHSVRNNRLNPQVDAFSLVQLLWKDEIVELFRMNGIERGIISKPKYVLWELLVNSFHFTVLKNYVLTALKSRRNWRAVQ